MTHNYLLRPSLTIFYFNVPSHIDNEGTLLRSSRASIASPRRMSDGFDKVIPHDIGEAACRVWAGFDWTDSVISHGIFQNLFISRVEPAVGSCCILPLYLISMTNFTLQLRCLMLVNGCCSFYLTPYTSTHLFFSTSM